MKNGGKNEREESRGATEAEKTNIYEYAIRLETEGEEFYRRAAGKTMHKGIRNILTMLADGKARHRTVFEHMKRREPWAVVDARLLPSARMVFEGIEGDPFEHIEVSEIETYGAAQAMEERSIAFFLEKAREMEGKPQAVAFRKVADEEQRHYFLLSNLIDFVSRPQTWLENAEWYHLDDY